MLPLLFVGGGTRSRFIDNVRKERHALLTTLFSPNRLRKNITRNAVLYQLQNTHLYNRAGAGTAAAGPPPFPDDARGGELRTGQLRSADGNHHGILGVSYLCADCGINNRKSVQ